MKKTTLLCLVLWIMTLAFPAQSEAKEKKSLSKLDCQEMALEFVAALENLDYLTFCRLTGKEYSEEDETDIKKEFDDPKKKEELVSLLAPIRLFPKIGEIPRWATKVEFQCEYVEGDKRMELKGEFVFNDGIWIIKELEPTESEFRDEEHKERVARNVSSAPPEGQKTLDAGLNELMKKLISAIKDKSWEGVKECGVHPDGCGLHPNDPPEEREKVIDLLEQFPSIGAIPAPAELVGLELKGNIDDEEVTVEVEFQWPRHKLEIYRIILRHEAIQEK